VVIVTVGVEDGEGKEVGKKGRGSREGAKVGGGVAGGGEIDEVDPKDISLCKA
jgi:hypothetical protein